MDPSQSRNDGRTLTSTSWAHATAKYQLLRALGEVRQAGAAEGGCPDDGRSLLLIAELILAVGNYNVICASVESNF